MTNNELRKQSLKRYEAVDIESAPAELTCLECNTTYKAGYVAVKCAILDIEIAKEKANN
jgi:Zn finger protein HypA/HybF involved in hydrogenase expression